MSKSNPQSPIPNPQSNLQPLTPAILDQLRQIVGDAHLSTSDADRQQHARDQSGHPPHEADAVIWPGSTAEIAAILRLAHEARIPVTAWGAGTSLEGNPIPLHGGIVLSLRRLDQIVAVHADDFQVTVRPGLGYKDLNRHLARYGLFFPPDPGANASIGGMLANNAAGIRTVKYGACRDNVLRLQVVLANGEILHAGSRSVKQSSGYDLVHLFVGSEGTLGIIAEATLRLAPIPEHVSAAVAAFPTVAAAVQAVVAVRGSGLEPAALEFIDAYHARVLSAEEGVDLAEYPTLFLEFHAAHRAALDLGLELAGEICRDLGALSFTATADPTARRRLWHARHHAYEIAQRNHPGRDFDILDVAVPLSAYPALVAHVEETLAARAATGYLIGHAGDGNLHVLLPHGDRAERDRAAAVNREIVLKAIALEGTASGEHGTGIGKARFLQQEHGAPAVALMRTLKHTLDPHGILNPGKILP